MVANEGLEKVRAYLNQVPPDLQLNVPSEGHTGIPSPQCLGWGWVYSEEKECPCCSVLPEIWVHNEIHNIKRLGEALPSEVL